MGHVVTTELKSATARSTNICQQFCFSYNFRHMPTEMCHEMYSCFIEQFSSVNITSMWKR